MKTQVLTCSKKRRGSDYSGYLKKLFFDNYDSEPTLEITEGNKSLALYYANYLKYFLSNLTIKKLEYFNMLVSTFFKYHLQDNF